MAAHTQRCPLFQFTCEEDTCDHILRDTPCYSYHVRRRIHLRRMICDNSMYPEASRPATMGSGCSGGGGGGGGASRAGQPGAGFILWSGKDVPQTRAVLTKRSGFRVQLGPPLFQVAMPRLLFGVGCRPFLRPYQLNTWIAREQRRYTTQQYSVYLHTVISRMCLERVLAP